MFSQFARRLGKYSTHIAVAAVSAAAMTAVCVTEEASKASTLKPTLSKNTPTITSSLWKLPSNTHLLASMSEDNFEDEEEDEVMPNVDDEDFIDELSMKNVYVETADNADLRIFCGTGNTMLSHAVASHLNVQMGRAKVHKYHDGEIAVQIFDSVRGRDCFVIQSLCGPNPHDQLMELLLLISSLRRASAGRIVAVLPYMAYARQLDGTAPHRDFIPAADIAKMLETMGVDHVVSVDLHRPQVIGFFKRAVCENLDTSNSVIPYLDAAKNIKGRKVTVVAPIGGTVKRAHRIQELLTRHGVDSNLAFTYLVSKRGGHVDSSDYKDHHMQLERTHEDVNVVGDIAGRDAIIVDDMIDSASRVSAVADALKLQGAKSVYAYATHGLFTGNAIERIEQSALNEVIVFDTVPLSPAQQSLYVRQLSASGLIAETIKRIHTNKSTVSLEHRYDMLWEAYAAGLRAAEPFDMVHKRIHVEPFQKDKDTWFSVYIDADAAHTHVNIDTTDISPFSVSQESNFTHKLHYVIPPYGKICIIGGGKAAVPMAAAAEHTLAPISSIPPFAAAVCKERLPSSSTHSSTYSNLSTHLGRVCGSMVYKDDVCIDDAHHEAHSKASNHLRCIRLCPGTHPIPSELSASATAVQLQLVRDVVATTARDKAVHTHMHAHTHTARSPSPHGTSSHSPRATSSTSIPTLPPTASSTSTLAAPPDSSTASTSTSTSTSTTHGDFSVSSSRFPISTSTRPTGGPVHSVEVEVLFLCLLSGGGSALLTAPAASLIRAVERVNAAALEPRSVEGATAAVTRVDEATHKKTGPKHNYTGVSHNQIATAPTQAAVPENQAVPASQSHMSQSQISVALPCSTSTTSALSPPSLAPLTPLQCLQQLGKALLASGAPIQDINAVRGQVDAVKAGGLGRACVGACVRQGLRVGVHTLALSDVLGDDLRVIASGPTVYTPMAGKDAEDMGNGGGGGGRGVDDCTSTSVGAAFGRVIEADVGAGGDDNAGSTAVICAHTAASTDLCGHAGVSTAAAATTIAEPTNIADSCASACAATTALALCCRWRVAEIMRAQSSDGARCWSAVEEAILSNILSNKRVNGGGGTGEGCSGAISQSIPYAGAMASRITGAEDRDTLRADSSNATARDQRSCDGARSLRVLSGCETAEVEVPRLGSSGELEVVDVGVREAGAYVTNCACVIGSNALSVHAAAECVQGRGAVLVGSDDDDDDQAGDGDDGRDDGTTAPDGAAASVGRRHCIEGRRRCVEGEASERARDMWEDALIRVGAWCEGDKTPVTVGAEINKREDGATREVELRGGTGKRQSCEQEHARVLSYVRGGELTVTLAPNPRFDDLHPAPGTPRVGGSGRNNGEVDSSTSGAAAGVACAASVVHSYTGTTSVTTPSLAANEGEHINKPRTLLHRYHAVRQRCAAVIRAATHSPEAHRPEEPNGGRCQEAALAWAVQCLYYMHVSLAANAGAVYERMRALTGDAPVVCADSCGVSGVPGAILQQQHHHERQRHQQLLSAWRAVVLHGYSLSALFAGTDGSDGPNDAAGGFVSVDGLWRLCFSVLTRAGAPTDTLTNSEAHASVGVDVDSCASGGDGVDCAAGDDAMSGDVNAALLHRRNHDECSEDVTKDDWESTEEDVIAPVLGCLRALWQWAADSLRTHTSYHWLHAAERLCRAGDEAQNKPDDIAGVSRVRHVRDAQKLRDARVSGDTIGVCVGVKGCALGAEIACDGGSSCGSDLANGGGGGAGSRSGSDSGSDGNDGQVDSMSTAPSILTTPLANGARPRTASGCRMSAEEVGIRHIFTGPTGTNVNDLYMWCAEKRESG